MYIVKKINQNKITYNVNYEEVESFKYETDAKKLLRNLKTKATKSGIKAEYVIVKTKDY